MAGIRFRDYIEFLFNSGRGIRTNQLDGDIDKDQLHDNAGKGVYVGEFVYSAANNRFALNVQLLGNAELPRGSVMYGRVPDATDRKNVGLTVSGQGLSGVALRDQGQRQVVARDLTPGCIHTIFRYVGGAGDLLFTETLPKRPKDYKIALVISEDNQLTQAEADAASSTTVTGRYVNAYVMDGGFTVRRYFFIGIPQDAPNLSEAYFGNETTGQYDGPLNILGTNRSAQFVYDSQWDGITFEGSPYWWYRSPLWNTLSFDAPENGFYVN